MKIRTFEDTELNGRVDRARESLRQQSFDAVLLFSQESLNYLTGYDTTGYVFFQCAVMTCDAGPLTLLTRRPDLAQARDTSTIEDIRVWYNAPGVNPAEELRSILAYKGLNGAQVGI